MKKFGIYGLITITLLLLSCGKKITEQTLLNKAKELTKQEQYSAAIEKYEQLLKEFPGSKKAAEATFEIAKIYQGQVINNLSPKESLLKSVSLYKEIFEKYPQSKYAAHSIFMAGFILANELNDIEGAKEAYNQYIKNYPEGELVKDAKVELQNLGKSPEEVLKEKLGHVIEDETQK